MLFYDLFTPCIFLFISAKNMKKTCRLGSYQHLLCVGHGHALHNLVTVDGFKHTSSIRELILNPHFQNLIDVKNYFQSSKLSAVEFLAKYVQDIGTDRMISSPNNSSLSKTESYVEELASVALTSTSQTVLERECYLLLSMHNKIKVTNVLTYWKDHSKMMPTLSNLATQIYGIPATSTPCERNFSVAGLINGERKSHRTIWI